MGRLRFDKKTALVAAALLAVWVCWGGTYLAIRFAVETIPSFLMAGVRFILAGALLYGAARLRGDVAPNRGHWLGAATVGVVLLAGGNGGVVLAAKMVPSSLTALIVATGALWMVVLNWLWLKAVRPKLVTWLGIGLGLAGIGILTGGDSALLGASQVSPLWTAVLTAAAFLWGLGSIASRRVSLPGSAVLSTGMQMLTGGAALTVIGLGLGEASQVDLAAVSLKSFLSFAYLVVFGSIVGFSAYVWLLQKASPVLVSTYAYVNPVVAVALGAALGGEALTGRTVAAALVIVVSVILLTYGQVGKKAEAPADAAAKECTCRA